jgi:hypothetical protein
MTDSLLAVGRAACERRGYQVTDPGRPWLPPRLASPTTDVDPFVPRAVTSLVAIEPIAPADLTPTMLVSRLRNNVGNERFSLFVVPDEETARTVRQVLHDPPLVASEDELGRRTFYAGPDRVALAEGGYAAVRTDSDPDRLVWREEGTADDRSLVLVDSGPDTAANDDETVLAHLDGVDELARPPAAAFPYSYTRDPDDKRFRIRVGDRRVVGVYDGVAAMRANAYLPVPMPLVPEHVFDGVASVRDEWAVLAAGDDGCGSDTDSPAAPTLVTAAGVFSGSR